MEIQKETLKGYIDAILTASIGEEEIYGYEIAKRIRDRSEGKFELKEGTMYLALKRLSEKGVLAWRWGDDDSGGGRRKYYRLTEEGEEALAQRRAEWAYFKPVLSKLIEGDSHEENR